MICLLITVLKKSEVLLWKCLLISQGMHFMTQGVLERQVRMHKVCHPTESRGRSCGPRAHSLGRRGRWRQGKERVNSSQDNKKFRANAIQYLEFFFFLRTVFEDLPPTLHICTLRETENREGGAILKQTTSQTSTKHEIDIKFIAGSLPGADEYKLNFLPNFFFFIRKCIAVA